MSKKTWIAAAIALSLATYATPTEATALSFKDYQSYRTLDNTISNYLEDVPEWKIDAIDGRHLFRESSGRFKIDDFYTRFNTLEVSRGPMQHPGIQYPQPAELDLYTSVDVSTFSISTVAMLGLLAFSRKESTETI